MADSYSQEDLVGISVDRVERLSTLFPPQHLSRLQLRVPTANWILSRLHQSPIITKATTLSKDQTPGTVRRLTAKMLIVQETHSENR